MNTIIEFIRITSIISPVAGLMIYLKFYAQSQRMTNLLALLMFVYLVCDICAYVMAVNRVPTTLLVNFTFFVEVPLVAAIYSDIFYEESSLKLKIITIALTVVFIVNTVAFQFFEEIQNLNWILSTLVISIFSFLHLGSWVQRPLKVVSKLPDFWITMGFLVYGAFNVVIFALSRYWAENVSPSEFKTAWAFHNVNNVLKNIGFAIAMWWAMKKEQEYDDVIDAFNARQQAKMEEVEAVVKEQKKD